MNSHLHRGQPSWVPSNLSDLADKEMAGMEGTPGCALIDRNVTV